MRLSAAALLAAAAAPADAQRPNVWIFLTVRSSALLWLQLFRCSPPPALSLHIYLPAS